MSDSLVMYQTVHVNGVERWTLCHIYPTFAILQPIRLTPHTIVIVAPYEYQRSSSPIVMWLLSTDRAELHQFNTPEDVPGGYAILSHVWGRDEQLFQDTEQLRVQCAATGVNPRDLASPKVRES